MKSLSSLVRDADATDPLAQTVRALLSSGLIVTTRDGAGRYVQLSPVYGRELGIEGLDGRGSTLEDAWVYFDAMGNELTRMEHPSQIARLTGEAQRLRVGGARSPNGREAWMINSFVPIERDEDGWSVLTVGAPLPRSVFTPPTTSYRDSGPFERVLLEFALRVAGRRMPPDPLVDALRPAVAAIADDPLSSSLMLLKDGYTHLSPIVRFTSVPVPPPMRLTDPAAVRWRMTETFYNPCMSDADVIGDRVIIELAEPIRSFALIPLLDGCGRKVASLALTAPTPHALGPHQQTALEQLARLAGPVLDLDSDCPAV